MTGFTKERTELGFIPDRSPRPTPDTSVAVGLQGAANVLNVVADQQEAERKAEAESQTIAAVNALERDNIDSVLGFNQKEVISSDPDLTPDDLNALKEAKEEAELLRAASRQGKSKTSLQIQLVANYRKQKNMFPHLAPDLRKYYKSETGKGILQTLLEEEEERKKTAADIDAADIKFERKFAQDHFLYNPNDTRDQRLVKIMPLMTKLRTAEQGAQTLTRLQQDSSIRHEQRKATQEAVYREAFPGFVLSTNMNIQEQLRDFDPITATPEERLELKQTLENQRVAFETDTRTQLSDMDPTFVDKQLNIVNSQFDSALDLVSGKTPKEFYDNTVAIITQSADLNLMRIPGFAEKNALLQKFKGLDANLIPAQTRVEFATQVVLPMAKALLLTIDQPTSNPYQELLSNSSGDEEIASFYKDLTRVMAGNLDDPESQQEAANVIEAWTNQFSVNPQDIPTGVYDEILKLSADPKFQGVVDKGLQLPQNFIEGMQQYTSRLQRKLGDDLSQDLGKKSTTFPSVTQSQRDKAFSSFFGGISIESRPRLFELLTVNFNKDGSVAWTPIEMVKTNVKVRKLAQEVSRKYGARIGRLVRSYAHVQQGDENYDKARTAILSGRAFTGLQQLELEVEAERIKEGEK